MRRPPRAPARRRRRRHAGAAVGGVGRHRRGEARRARVVLRSELRVHAVVRRDVGQRRAQQPRRVAVRRSSLATRAREVGAHGGVPRGDRAGEPVRAGRAGVEQLLRRLHVAARQREQQRALAARVDAVAGGGFGGAVAGAQGGDLDAPGQR